MSSTRYCKCHFHEGESEHWGLLDRKSFAHKGAKAHYTPDAQVLPEHLTLDLNFDWKEERVWGSTQYDLEIKGHGVEEVVFCMQSILKSLRVFDWQKISRFLRTPEQK